MPPGPKPVRLTQPSCTGPPQVGFVFDPLDSAWNQRLAELWLYKEANGGKVDVPRNDLEWPGLGDWCNTQARPSPRARRLTEPGTYCTWPVNYQEGISTGFIGDWPTAVRDAGTRLVVVGFCEGVQLDSWCGANVTVFDIAGSIVDIGLAE